MMMPVEKNDVDLDRLFNWSKKVSLKAKNGEVVDFYIRLVGDADANKARVMALRASAEMREKLRDASSDERKAFIPVFTERDKPRLVEFLLVLEAKDFSRQALRDVNVPVPREPKSDARLEEWERFQKEVDEYPVRRQEAISAYIFNLVEKRRKALEEKSFEELQELFVERIIEEVCEQHMFKTYREWCTYLGTYRDENFTQPFFSSFEEFSNLPTALKETLITEYLSLEIDGDELKKSPQATP